MTLSLLIVVVIIALAFEYINGFHDTANSISTVVSTKALTARQAVLYSACLNCLGAFMGTHVAKTIGAGIVDVGSVTQLVIICALVGAIVWNLFTWLLGLPSSSSHALIGGLLGASMMHAGFSVVHVKGIVEKVIIPMIISPVVGFFIGFMVMLVLIRLFHKTTPEKTNRNFKKIQIFSSGIMAFSHGSNDAQKTMGIITLALVSYGSLTEFVVPTWVILACAITMGLGTMAGGWRIIRTMGSKVIKMRPIHGFATEMTVSSVILSASHFGIPVSTTHIVASSIMGVGSTVRLSAVKWGIVGNIIWAWTLTIPVCAAISAGVYKLLVLI